MAGKGQGHVKAAPVITTATPFFSAGALGLRRLAVIEEKARVSFQRIQHTAMRKNPGVPDKVSRPIAAAFRLARIKEDKVLSGLGIWMIAIGGVEVANMIRRIFE